MTQPTIAKICALAAGILVLPTVSFAGTAAKEAKPIVEQVKESCISGDLGVNVVSQYISRGFIYENDGLITQPYADLYFKLYEGEGFVNKVSLALGIWSSFHSKKTDAGLASGGTGSTTRSWYENDFTVGVPITFAKNFTFTPSYYWFLSPNDGFSTFQGINLALAYDDSDALGKFALHPKVQVLFELENKIGSGPNEGIYYEIALAPALPAFGDLTVSFPLTAGFGSNGFYPTNESFGFASGGVNLAYAMSFVPECYGAWTASASATYYYLGNGVDTYNVPGVRDSDENEVIYSAGISLAF